MSNVSKYGYSPIASPGAGGVASEPIKSSEDLIWSTAEAAAQEQAKKPIWLTVPELEADSNYVMGTVLDHLGEEVNPMFENARESLVNYLGEYPDQAMVPTAKLWPSTGVHFPEEADNVNTYVCTICRGSGSSPLLTGQLHYEEYIEALDMFELKPKGTLKAFFCTACNGTGIPPIPPGEFDE